ncbi:AI-2E family transporter [Mesobaculum littorinae]|uniref:AI-2E family transporter n=1 Tax=Mesobaculum littorinae TaxID=2486419 RepID=A0A438AI02_9RHOB|nr:AI-2E family transporter [Mesobaculum littorinae]
MELLLWGIFLLAAFAAFYFAQVVLMPIVLALLITLTLTPVVRWLRRRGVPQVVSAIGIVVLISVVFGYGLYIMSGPVSNLMDEVPELGTRLQDKLSTLTSSFEQMQRATEQVEKLADGTDPDMGQQEVRAVVDSQRGLLSRALTSLVGAGTALFIALILTMFLLSNWDMFQLKIVTAMPTLTDKKRALGIVRSIEKQVSRYLAAITVINAGLGVAIGVALWLIGMDYPYLWGLAAFLLNYLPFMGAMAGTVAAGVISLLTFDSVSYALLAPLTYFALTSIEGQIITPTLVGRQLEMNVVAVFVTVIFWTWFWGIPGALMAVPFLLLLKVICDNVAGLKVLGTFLSGAPPVIDKDENEDSSAAV